MIEISKPCVYVLENGILKAPLFEIERDYKSQLHNLCRSYEFNSFFMTLKHIHSSVPWDEIIYCKDEDMVPILEGIFKRDVVAIEGIPYLHSPAVSHLANVLNYAHRLRQYVSEDDDEFILPEGPT